MKNNWKKREGVVYSTNQDFEYECDKPEVVETLLPENQNLKVFIDNKQRKGKTVTMITGFIGTHEDLNTLAKELKTKCGVGGSTKNGEIIIQGEFKEKIFEYLTKQNYKVKK
ncbi:translation initiation factor, partial [Bacteroidales bacterium OttesenSCG-928-I21]|nr:translation initiation factor [Bacteroidales bacterium OttesenSCG-928-I21]